MFKIPLIAVQMGNVLLFTPQIVMANDERERPMRKGRMSILSDDYYMSLISRDNGNYTSIHLLQHKY